MWIVVFLVGIIILLMAWILFFGGAGVTHQRKLRKEITRLKDELSRLQEANEALRATLGAGSEERLRRYGKLFEFIRDLESLRCAIAGSKICQASLSKKYDTIPGPDMLKRILAQPGVDPVIKNRLADELLVGEVGRALMLSLDKGFSIDKAAANAGVPLVVARGQITRLQILGYLDSHLKLTEQGREALV
ncbi:MAG: hypothetical protein DRN83_02630 [Hadesarchaea archaeon]|nr:MAG: hypothetical protein DRN83_02630 [Hadesarchaea archaeon]